MFKVEKGTDKAVITAYGHVGGYYLDYRNIAEALSDISRSGYKQVDIRMHTYGGSVIEGNLIFNFITNFKGQIDIFVDGIAASMGSIIALASDRLHIAENGFIMIHSPKGSGYGTARELTESAKLLTSLEKNFTSKLAARMGKTPEQIRATYFDGIDHWIDADEAVSLKLASDKFTAKNGNISFTKADAEREGIKGIYSQYTALLDIDTPNPISHIPKTDMKNVNMKLGLAEGASEQEAIMTIEATLKRATDAEAALKVIQDKEKLVLKAEAKTLLDSALADGKISATGRAAWEAQFEKDHESAKALLECVPKRATAQAVVEAGQKPGDIKLLTMSWDELDKQGRIIEMKAKFPEEYKELFKKEFGTYPNA